MILFITTRMLFFSESIFIETLELLIINGVEKLALCIVHIKCSCQLKFQLFTSSIDRADIFEVLFMLTAHIIAYFIASKSFVFFSVIRGPALLRRMDIKYMLR